MGDLNAPNPTQYNLKEAVGSKNTSLKKTTKKQLFNYRFEMARYRWIGCARRTSAAAAAAAELRSGLKFLSELFACQPTVNIFF